MRYPVSLSRNLGAHGYQRAARQLLKARIEQMPEGIWRSVVHSTLVFARARAVLAAMLLGWIASGLVTYTGGGLLLQVLVVGSAVLSYWSRLALIVLFR